jgi:hypothetical protein
LSILNLKNNRIYGTSLVFSSSNDKCYICWFFFLQYLTGKMKRICGISLLFYLLLRYVVVEMTDPSAGSHLFFRYVTTLWILRHDLLQQWYSQWRWTFRITFTPSQLLTLVKWMFFSGSVKSQWTRMTLVINPITCNLQARKKCCGEVVQS